jgi:SOS-response transcriptional repressor LexA
MAPALRHGDHLLVRYGGASAVGDIVVAALPDGTLAVKRLARVETDGRVWLLGDNPFGSADSRSLGALDASAVRGRILARLWPRPRLARKLGPPGPWDV